MKYIEYIDYLCKMIEQEKEALERAENDEIKAAIQRRLDAFTADLEAVAVYDQPEFSEIKIEPQDVENPFVQDFETPSEFTGESEEVDGEEEDDEDEEEE